MKIIVEKSTNKVIYSGESLVLTEEKLIGPYWINYDLNLNTADIFDVELPSNFVGGAWTYIDGVWNIIDQELLNSGIEFKNTKIKNEIIVSTQLRLDDFAKTRNYDSILSAASYATSKIPKFALEGQYAVDARDTTWATLYTILGEVQAGTRPMPTSFADIESLLPELTWPA